MIKKKVFIETYGCQMNVYDSELAVSFLVNAGYQRTEDIGQADVILVNTCSIRENAEQRVFGRLDRFLQEKKKRNLVVGVLGCMAERIQDKLFEHQAVDLVIGPDSYRELLNLTQKAEQKGKQIDVELSVDETYADVEPIRMDKNGVTSFISIMRGCNNMCTYCIVPYVRGRERSRDPHTIVKEARHLFDSGYREVCLLGQNVDSYNWINPDNANEQVDFSQLIELVAQVNPLLRVRFSTSHPKDMGNAVLYSMAMYSNICTHIHLPVQSGSDRMLEKMNRKYTREKYLERVNKIREIIPNACITTDIIAGFCSETEEDHQDTISLMKEVQYDSAFMFQYSTRPNTIAARRFEDDVTPEVKNRRLNEIIELQNKISHDSNQKDIGKVFEVLIEGVSKRNEEELLGRTSGNKACIFPGEGHKLGDYVRVKIERASSATLIGKIIND